MDFAPVLDANGLLIERSPLCTLQFPKVTTMPPQYPVDDRRLTLGLGR